MNFTGQNQDTVPSQSSGLYDFLFREFNPQHGRWISPDPDGMSAVSMGNPQTWNRYAYVANGPLTSTDQLGLVNTDRFDVGGFDDSCSIDGMAASCGLVDGLADMGGGGEAGILLNGYLNPVNIGIGWAIPSFSSEGLIDLCINNAIQS